MTRNSGARLSDRDACADLQNLQESPNVRENGKIMGKAKNVYIWLLLLLFFWKEWLYSKESYTV